MFVQQAVNALLNEGCKYLWIIISRGGRLKPQNENLTTISFKDFNSQKKNKFFMEELKVMSFSPTKGILCESED